MAVAQIGQCSRCTALAVGFLFLRFSHVEPRTARFRFEPAMRPLRRLRRRCSELRHKLRLLIRSLLLILTRMAGGI